jgi:hypothetical protein
MKKTTAELLNAIPDGIDLGTYFDSLDIFDKRELINELEVSKSFFTKNYKRNTFLVFVSYLISFSCYFGIKETWFIYYLICVNIPLTIFLFLSIKNSLEYLRAIKKLERKLSQ